MSGVKDEDFNELVQEVSPDQCPTCGSAVEVVRNAIGARYEHRIRLGEIALALSNEDVARELSTIVPAGAKVMLAGILLGTRGDRDPFFAVENVRDLAEHAARSELVVKQLRTRRQFDEAAAWELTVQRMRKLAIRIALLLSDDERALVHQQIHGTPLADPPRSPLEVVKS